MPSKYRNKIIFASLSSSIFLFTGVIANAQSLKNDNGETVLITAKRKTESQQKAAISVSTVTGLQLEQSGTFNTNRLQQIQPALQFYSQNQRNTTVNIRGIGAPFGLTNDGIEQGVGFYLDDVYYSRIAASTFDFLDVQQIEVLRGPQGTLYGKNTTAGAMNISSRQPSFTPETRLAASFGNLFYLQAKGAINRPITDSLAARFSFSYSRRLGTAYNVALAEHINEIDNFGARAQFLYNQNENLSHTLAFDYNQQRPNGSGLVYAKTIPTARAINRQYQALADYFNYDPPSQNPFDRLVDHDSTTKGHQTFGGLSVRSKFKALGGEFTNVISWRYWDWDPSNDRDWIGLPITTVSQNPSKQRQWIEELRFNKSFGDKIDLVAGVFAFHQSVKSTGSQEQGSAASYWLLGPPNAATLAALGTNSYSSLLDGLRQDTDISYTNDSAAIFGRLTFAITDKFKIEPGLRFNYDKKQAHYNAVVSGGLATNDPLLISRKNSVLQSQAYETDFDATNTSGDLTLSYNPIENLLFYGTYAKSFRSGGVNLSGIPARADGTPALETAVVKPESINHYELGAKSQFLDRKITLNLSIFRTNIEDYQATVVNGAIGVLRGYLANADEVQTQGFELEGKWRLNDNLRLYANYAYNDAKYTSFKDAPIALELSGGSAQVADISGTPLPGVSKYSVSYGFEYIIPANNIPNGQEFYLGGDFSRRSNWSSSPTVSQYMWVKGYQLANLRAGIRLNNGLDFNAWVKNAGDTEYYEQFIAQSGSTGLIVGQIGDPRTYGLTISSKF